MQGQGVIEGQIEIEEEDQENQYIFIAKEDYHEVDRDERSRYLQPPISLPSRHYSLQPDYVGGWKPKKITKPKYVNIFPLRYDEKITDQVIKQLVKNKNKYNEAVIYLGPRKNNSFLLHQNRLYQNPYKFQRKVEQIGLGRNGLPQQIQLRTSYLRFNSDFQGGNLDAVIQRSSDQFDLFMRVDTNTQGHTNWFYYEIYNDQFIGTVNFNLCNFRRPNSLYQRVFMDLQKGLKPYVWSKEKKQIKWVQQGENVKYQKQRLKYKLPFNNSEQILNPMLNTFYALTFAYKFQVPHDTVKFAYCPPYLYSQLNQFLAPLSQFQIKTPLKSLSGLNIPVLRITNEDHEESSKKVALITSRIHPGQSNSSYVAEGFLQFLCSNQAIAKELRTKYIFYVIPMLNPDGVVAGNYRTSLFGKDLNRTFDQQRRYAFPEIYKLLRYAQQLKKIHKKRFCLYIDLHGHSIKKNVFMYGPDYSIQDSNYEVSRQLPKILGNVTQFFRFYSCSFRISDTKASTGRAIFNRTLKIPYTYTMESSNGSYLDFSTHSQVPFTIQRWKEMGVYLAMGLNMLKLQKNQKILRVNTQKISKKYFYSQNNIGVDRISDDDIDEQDSDMQPQNQDLPQEMLKQIQFAVKGKTIKDNQSQKNHHIHQQSPYLQTNTQNNQLKKPKKKQFKLQQLSKRQVKIDTKRVDPKEICAFQIPQRKNISFPTIYRGQIFMSRQSKNQKYQIALQSRQIDIQRRFKKHQSQIYKTLQAKHKNNMVPINVPTSNQKKLPWQTVPKKQYNFNELIKRYKFNF